MISVLLFYFALIPNRLKNLILLFDFFSKRNNHRHGLNQPTIVINRAVTWVIHLIFKLLDLSGIWEFIDFASRWIKPNTRFLSRTEIDLLQSHFGKRSMLLFVIGIDELSLMAFLGKKYTGKKRLGVTTLRKINFSQRLHLDNLSDQKWLVHEFVHVLQMQSIGGIYMLEALIAQQRLGYDYVLKTESRLKDFNLEQQAEIVSDIIFDDSSDQIELNRVLLNDALHGRF